MKLAKKSILPELNNAVIFRTDTISNHGFPDPINCPENLSRKSIALYYYVKETGNNQMNKCKWGLIHMVSVPPKQVIEKSYPKERKLELISHFDLYRDETSHGFLSVIFEFI